MEIKTFLPDEGVEDAFEDLAFGGVLEDEFAEFVAVDGVATGEEVCAELLGDGGDDGDGLEVFTSGDVGVEEGGVGDGFAKEFDEGGFAGGDSSGEGVGFHFC